MLNKVAIAEKLKKNSAKLDSIGVKRLYLFGSYLNGHNHPKSDIDFVLDYKKDIHFDLFDLIAVQLELKKIFRKKIDLLTPNGIHPALKDSILSQMETIYEN